MPDSPGGREFWKRDRWPRALCLAQKASRGQPGFVRRPPAAHWAQRGGGCQREAGVRCVIELGAAWIPHKAQHHSEAGCVMGVNGPHYPQGHPYFDELWKSEKISPKNHICKDSIIQLREHSTLSLWVAGNPAQMASYILSNMPEAHWKWTKTGIQDPSRFTESGIVCAFAWHQQGWDRGRSSWWGGSPHVSPVPLDFSTPLACIHSLTFSPLKSKNTASSITDMLGFKGTGSEFPLFFFFKQMRRAQLAREEVRREGGKTRANEGCFLPAPCQGEALVWRLGSRWGDRSSGWCAHVAPQRPCVLTPPCSPSLYTVFPVLPTVLWKAYMFLVLPGTLTSNRGRTWGGGRFGRGGK